MQRAVRKEFYSTDDKFLFVWNLGGINTPQMCSSVFHHTFVFYLIAKLKGVYFPQESLKLKVSNTTHEQIMQGEEQ